MSLNLETSPVVAADTPQIQEPVEKDVEELTSFYAVQIMSVAKLLKSDDPQLKGLKAEPYRPAGSSAYKYIIGKFKTSEQASAELKKIKAKFPQAFIIYVDKK